YCGRGTSIGKTVEKESMQYGGFGESYCCIGSFCIFSRSKKSFLALLFFHKQNKNSSHPSAH
ncbi:hypothetical protein, partial [uncultured Megasphaera sp.]|uniref:hypothetical protein n=1 Tax=uncultured Megasphaera sp. TaxID=165188 RepID=UPI002588DE40